MLGHKEHHLTSSIKPHRLENCAHLEAYSVRYALLKRATDIIGALFMLLLLLPITLVIALLIKLEDRGPIFYRSNRVGHCGRLFRFVKFRTMVVDAERKIDDLKQFNEKDGPIFKMKNDPRITRIGRFLRRYSLDEIPQFWSVLVGDMSMVGPRPMLPHEVLQFAPENLERLRVKPGITCYWQVMGRSRLSFEEWMRLDRKYLETMSPATDLMLMLKTPISVLRSDGSY
jgi:lipopolysaccharide/colanic/teichoic acid biosynthesis glycosyltransferase